MHVLNVLAAPHDCALPIHDRRVMVLLLMWLLVRGLLVMRHLLQLPGLEANSLESVRWSVVVDDSVLGSVELRSHRKARRVAQSIVRNGDVTSGTMARKRVWRWSQSFGRHLRGSSCDSHGAPR